MGDLIFVIILVALFGLAILGGAAAGGTLGTLIRYWTRPKRRG